MRKSLLLTLSVAPLLLCCNKKDKTDSPLQFGPRIEASTWLEAEPVNGRSTIVFNKDHTFTVRNLNQTPVGGAIADHVYKYKIENGKIVATPPPYDSYWLRNPITYTFTNDGELYIDNFRPVIWGHDAGTVRLKKQQ